MVSAELTVVIPVFNGQRYLKQTLDSAARQQGPEIATVIVDYGSTDISLAIAENMNSGQRLSSKGTPG